MSFYEELLTLGSHLRESERVALYKFFLTAKRADYYSNAIELVKSGELKREIANGEILYTIRGGVLAYSARKKGTTSYMENLRLIKLSRFSKIRIEKIIKFFAQSEVDVIWNYPAPSSQPEEGGNFSIISIPYFDLRYYSARRSRVLGLINKIKSDDSKILQQLRAS
jgi:hypothetical protein